MAIQPRNQIYSCKFSHFITASLNASTEVVLSNASFLSLIKGTSPPYISAILAIFLSSVETIILFISLLSFAACKE